MRLASWAKGFVVACISVPYLIGCATGGDDNMNPDDGIDDNNNTGGNKGKKPSGKGGNNSGVIDDGCDCEPGEEVACSCKNGTISKRTCKNNCTEFTACACGSSSGGGDESPPVEPTDAPSPCGQVPFSGICEDEKTLKKCIVPSDDGIATAVTTQCGATETCVIVDGEAHCKQQKNKCRPGKTECVGMDQAKKCETDGTWSTYECSRCAPTALGVSCTGIVNAVKHTGVLLYEGHEPNSTYRDWSSTRVVKPAAGLLVVSLKYDPVANLNEVIDFTVTDKDGKYTVGIDENVSDNDRIAFFTLGLDANYTAEFAVAFPPDGTPSPWNVVNSFPAKESLLYAWSIRTKNRGSMNSSYTVTIEDGSFPIRLYTILHQAYNQTSAIMGSRGAPVVVWVKENLRFSCGACQYDQPAQVGINKFKKQIFFSADQKNQAYWSDAVTAHEIGHWVMASWGTSPREGGTHYLGCPTFPGQAWSEGWATWFSSLFRSSSRYYDKQNGSFFWLDIATRTYGSSRPWVRPQASDGLLQQIDENEVAAMMWGLSDTEAPMMTRGNNEDMLRALQSRRMNKKPFARGYTTHTWKLNSGSCQKIDVKTNSSWSAPMFADYLDALRCSSVAANQIDPVTQPATYYPYPSNSPLCR